MIDVSKLRPGVKVKMADGETGLLRGSYMTETGIAFTVKTNMQSICDRNVPLADIVEIVEET
jgi:hypothetical protein